MRIIGVHVLGNGVALVERMAVRCEDVRGRWFKPGALHHASVDMAIADKRPENRVTCKQSSRKLIIKL